MTEVLPGKREQLWLPVVLISGTLAALLPLGAIVFAYLAAAVAGRQLGRVFPAPSVWTGIIKGRGGVVVVHRTNDRRMVVVFGKGPHSQPHCWSIQRVSRPIGALPLPWRYANYLAVPHLFRGGKRFTAPFAPAAGVFLFEAKDVVRGGVAPHAGFAGGQQETSLLDCGTVVLNAEGLFVFPIPRCRGSEQIIQIGAMATEMELLGRPPR